MPDSNAEQATARGYAHPAYAAALAGENPVRALLLSGGALIVRPIAGSQLHDAAAPYPFLVCTRWQQLAEDMAEAAKSAVSITAVTDPFAGAGEVQLRPAFNAMVRPYKTHFVIDLGRPPEDFADPHNLGCARRALKKIEVERCAEPAVHFVDWLRLYGILAARHGLKGASLMSERSLAGQFKVPGFRLFRALRSGRTVGMIAMMELKERAYFHLGAYDEEGYRSNASYALVRRIVDHYRAAGFEALSIGAGAGAFGTGNDGLTAFKRGWSSGTRQTFLCGHIGAPQAYAELSRLHEAEGGYFPAYRYGEFD